MKILHIIDSAGLYGAEIMLLNLMEEQKKMGLSPVLCSIGEKNIVEKQLEIESRRHGLQVEIFRMRSGLNIIGALNIIRYASREHFDIIHSHGYKGNILLGFIPKSVRNIPLVTTLHGWTSTNGLSRMRLYEWLDAKSLQFIDAVILVNKKMLSDNRIKVIKGNKLSVIYNGIPLLNFSNLSQTIDFSITQDPEKKSLLDPKIVEFCQHGFIIGSIGRLSKEKGYRYLLGALHILRTKHLNVKLIIIGEGDERHSLIELIKKLNISSYVLLPGYRDNANKYLPLFNIFVLSSLTEGLPITLLEAMQVRIPVVATRVGGIPEVLENGKGGLLIKPGDPKGLSEAIALVYSNPQVVEKIVSFSYNNAITRYTSSKMVQQYYEIYKKVL